MKILYSGLVAGAVVLGITGCGGSGDQASGMGYSTVTSPHTGKIWLDRNLGASRVCVSPDDTECYGDYYQWGREADGHQDSHSSITLVLADTLHAGHGDFIAESDDWTTADADGAERSAFWSLSDRSSICPQGFRVPTKEELKAETVDVGVSDDVDAFNSFLKLPSAGYRHYSDGSLRQIGIYGHYWSATQSGIVAESSYLGFGPGIAGMFNDERAFAYPVRCIKE